MGVHTLQFIRKTKFYLQTTQVTDVAEAITDSETLSCAPSECTVTRPAGSPIVNPIPSNRLFTIKLQSAIHQHTNWGRVESLHHSMLED